MSLYSPKVCGSDTKILCRTLLGIQCQFFFLIHGNTILHTDRPVECKISTIQWRELPAYSLAFGRASLGHTQMTQFAWIEHCTSWRVKQNFPKSYWLPEFIHRKHVRNSHNCLWGPQTIYRSFILFKQPFLWFTVIQIDVFLTQFVFLTLFQRRKISIYDVSVSCFLWYGLIYVQLQFCAHEWMFFMVFSTFFIVSINILIFVLDIETTTIL